MHSLFKQRGTGCVNKKCLAELCKKHLHHAWRHIAPGVWRAHIVEFTVRFGSFPWNSPKTCHIIYAL